jgi:hypothetical protein
VIFFEKFNTLDPILQGNNTIIIIVTGKLKTFIGKLGLWVRKLERKQCIKAHLVICSPGIVKYFPEAVTDKYKWIMDPFHPD